MRRVLLVCDHERWFNLGTKCCVGWRNLQLCAKGMNLPRSVEMGRRPRCSATRGPSPDVEAANKTRKKKCVISSDHRSISVAHLQEGIELGPCPFRRLIQQPDRLRRSRRRGAFRLSPEAACQLGRFPPREERLRNTKNVNVSLGEMREVRHVRELVSPKTPMHATLRGRSLR